MPDPRPCARCGETPKDPAGRFCTRCGAAVGEVAPTAMVEHAAPAGPRCAAHPFQAAAEVCARCGTFACAECVKADTRGRALCPTCFSLERAALWQVPWEERGRLGLFNAFWQTARSTMFSPGLCYPGLSPTGRLWDPISYALFASTACLLAALVGLGALASIIALVAAGRQAAQGIGIGAAALGGIAIALPLLMLVRIFLLAGVEHLGLIILGASQNGFEATLRAHCYATGPAVFLVIPLCGPYIAEIWQMVLRVLGYRSVHKTSIGKAVFAVLAPIALCGGLYFLLIVGAQLLAMRAT